MIHFLAKRKFNTIDVWGMMTAILLLTCFHPGLAAIVLIIFGALSVWAESV